MARGGLEPPTSPVSAIIAYAIPLLSFRSGAHRCNDVTELYRILLILESHGVFANHGCMSPIGTRKMNPFLRICVKSVW
jgi:hypothetical protein